jgi:hypothetical protein
MERHSKDDGSDYTSEAEAIYDVVTAWNDTMSFGVPYVE